MGFDRTGQFANTASVCVCSLMTISVLCAVGISGCGIQAMPSRQESEDPLETGNTPMGEQRTVIATPVTNPTDISPPLARDAVQSFVVPGFVALFDPNDLAFLFGLFVDGSTLELLAPNGPQLAGSLTFLERLCRESDQADFVCRDRFGN